MQRSRGGRPFGPEAVRDEALVCRAWLAAELAAAAGRLGRDGRRDSLRAERAQRGPALWPAAGSASFCNADDDLLPAADLWLHGHLHCRHDYVVSRAGGSTRVVCNARGHERRGEAEGHVPGLILEV